MKTRRMVQFLGAVFIAVGGVLGFAGAASAHTGSTAATQTCFTWQASASLANNVTADRWVEVVTTIPGTTGLVKHHHGTIGNAGSVVIWSANGAAVVHGGVTLNIYNGNQLEFTASSTLPTPPSCVTTTTTHPTTTTTVASTTTTTAPTTTTTKPTTTTTVASTTTTTAPTTTTTVASTTTTTAPTTTTTAPTTTTTEHQETTTTTRPTTTSTVATTTTTVASTTTTVAPTTTTVAPTTTTVVETTTTLPVTTTVTSPGRFQLAHTGGNPTGGITIGVTLVGVGVILLLAGRHARKYS